MLGSAAAGAGEQCAPAALIRPRRAALQLHRRTARSQTVPNPRIYWFPAKTYGWGWGPPATWQGWVVLLVWGVALAEGLFLLRHAAYQLPYRVVFVLLMGAILGLVCYLTGEPPKWRWGKRPE
jgi:hypothetical protein